MKNKIDEKVLERLDDLFLHFSKQFQKEKSSAAIEVIPVLRLDEK